MTEFLVTGASGFLGEAICSELAALKLPVTALSRKPFAPPLGVKFQLIKSYSELPHISGKALIHCAQAHVLPDNGQNSDVAKDSIETMEKLCSAGLDQLIFISSGAVYGDSVLKWRETDKPQSTSAYAQMKLACETLVLEAGYTVVRPSNIYGAKMSSQNVISKIIQQLEYKVLSLHNTSSTRDFLFVTDAARGIAQLAMTRATGIFNLSSGIGTSITSLLEVIYKVCNKRMPEVQVENSNGSASTVVLDVQKLRSLIHWQPEFGIEEGIQALFKDKS